MKVCVNCFNDLELKQFIFTNSHEKGKCDYCSSKNSELLQIDELLDFFAEFIQIFKLDTNGIPLVELIQKDWYLFTSETDCQNILSDILLSLKSSFTNTLETVSYSDDIIECTSYWEILKDDLKWKHRFLTDIDRLNELSWDSFFNKTIKWPNSEPLYRARLHYSGDQNIFEIKDMGCPEKTKAPSGRANPQGIPFLYLSTDIETTLYEIRATFLDEISVGTFRIKDKSELVLVDFTESPSAYLNVDDIINYTKSLILKKYISNDLSKPIRRYDSELEYIPTQLICEFIRYITGADGILFNSSVHNGGKNIVLFEQDKVKCISVVMHRVTKVEIESKNI
jgi:hypothetical protein